MGVVEYGGLAQLSSTGQWEVKTFLLIFAGAEVLALVYMVWYHFKNEK